MKEVSVGILIRGTTVLAGQRRRTVRYPLKWEFPGGKIEQGETPSEALVRELREELAIEAVPGENFHVQEWTYGDQAYRVHYFCIASFSGNPINHTFERLAWLSPAELLQMDILEGNRDALLRLDEMMTKGRG